MSVEHRSRRGQTWYLHAKATATGKSSYFFSMDADGQLVQAVPDGYEIYENVNSQVFLRKKTAQVIQPKELAIVEDALRRHEDPWRHWVEVKKDVIVVYHAGEMNGIDGMLASFGRSPLTETDRRRFATYTAMLRFTLVDKKARVFVAERFCFRGSIDDWIPIGGPAPLAAHVRQFVRHLGRESFYELF